MGSCIGKGYRQLCDCGVVGGQCRFAILHTNILKGKLLCEVVIVSGNGQPSPEIHPFSSSTFALVGPRATILPQNSTIVCKFFNKNDKLLIPASLPSRIGLPFQVIVACKAPWLNIFPQSADRVESKQPEEV